MGAGDAEPATEIRVVDRDPAVFGLATQLNKLHQHEHAR